MTTPSAQTSPIGQSDVEMLVHLADNMGFGRTHDMLRRVIAATPYFNAPAVGPLPLSPQEPGETWAYIERLLHDECGLRLDEGLEGQRANIVNAIKNGRDARPDAALLKAAIEFLSKGEGLHKIRVNGKMMARKQIAGALAALPSEAIGREEIVPHDGHVSVEYTASKGLSRIGCWVTREEGERIRASRVALSVSRPHHSGEAQ